MADELERIPEDLRSDLSVAAVDLLLRENAHLKARVEQRDKQIAVFNSGGFADADALAEKFADLQAKLEEKEREKCPDCNYPREKHCKNIGLTEEQENQYIPCEYCFLKRENAALKRPVTEDSLNVIVKAITAVVVVPK